MTLGRQSQGDVHFRVPLWTAFGVLIPLLPMLPSYLVQGPGRPRVPLAFVLAYAVLAIACVAFQRWAGLVLTPTHAVLRGFTVRRIPWSAITGVGQQHVLGADRIVLWVNDGRSIRTRAPYASFGIGYAEFQRKFHMIGQWWLSHH